MTAFRGAGTILCLAAVASAQQSRLIHVKPTSPADPATGDDIAQLKELAAGVGWEFAPNAETTEGLARIGIRRVRCINVEPLPGHFDGEGVFQVDTAKRTRLDAHLDTCRAIGAQPHVIIATNMPKELLLTEEEVASQSEGIMGQQKRSRHAYGPKDGGKYRSYIKATIRHVMLTRGFRDAAFEVANEPDIGGAMVSRPPRPAMGSRRLYEEYFEHLYRNCAMAARELEQEHPGLRVTLGGPALAWAFTFAFGDFNWTERFLRDVGREKLKCNFLGIHFYGNIGPLDGSAKTGAYPPFMEMMRMTREWRDEHMPGLPIHITEWGASYHTNLSEKSLHNGSHVGAAFAAAFLNKMLAAGVDKALYLVTTDLSQQQEGKWVSVWGWPSLFTNPGAVGVHPKAPYHVFRMVSRLASQRVEVSDPGGTMGCIASAGSGPRLTVMLWNHSHTLPESAAGVETGEDTLVVIRVADAVRFFGGREVRVARHLVSETVSNALHLFQQGEPIDDRADLQQVDSGTLSCTDGVLEVRFVQPPSSVSFVELRPEARPADEPRP